MKSLLEEVGDRLQRTYNTIRQQVDHVDLSACLVDRTRCRNLTQAAGWHDWNPNIAATVYKHLEGDLRLAVYYPQQLIQVLEEELPKQELSTGNAPFFSMLFEEASHAVHISGDFQRKQMPYPADQEYKTHLEARAKLDVYSLLSSMVVKHTGAPPTQEIQRLLQQVSFEDHNRDNATSAQIYSDSSAIARRSLALLKKVEDTGERTQAFRLLQTASVAERNERLSQITL